MTFIQVWKVADAAGQRDWLRVMHSNIGILRSKPGFVSMTLHVSIDGSRLAVYAQWTSRAALEAAIGDHVAVEAHDVMARIGSSEGDVYEVDEVFLPIS
jgi:hypothetical protein